MTEPADKLDNVEPTEPVAPVAARKVEEAVDTHANDSGLAALRKEFKDELSALEARLTTKKESKENALPKEKEDEPAAADKPVTKKPAKFHLFRTL